MNATVVEEWRPVVGYENHYEVSSLGRVRSIGRTVRHWKGGESQIAGQILKVCVNRIGYSIVYLSIQSKKTTCAVHRLVAAAFLVPIDGKPEVNHVNGNKSINAASNLEWASRSENMRHAVRCGLAKSPDNGLRKPDHTLEEALRLRANGVSMPRICKELSISKSWFFRRMKATQAKQGAVQ